MNTEHFDVIIVGAGLSGIGAAYHLQENCPGKSYVILEGRKALGGTWDLFRYPGIRSDSDMYTLGYNFKPWKEAKDIADGPAILKYVTETAVENGIDKQIRYNHMVEEAKWSSADSTWTIEATLKETGETVQLSCNFLLMCSGYYSYKGGHSPDFQGREDFQGQIIHPQKWPEDLDYQGKKVVVIGSGATAVTIIPSISDDVEHVTMLQRSPTYMAVRPDEDPLAHKLRKYLPSKVAYAIMRWRNVTFTDYFYNRTRKEPEKCKEDLLKGVRGQLSPDYDIETHFTPSYNPWDQRLCLVPNGDLFTAIKSGKASVVTDHIERFTGKGILLKSGQELEADIIVTATGLKMVVMGNINFVVDGKPVDFSETYTYKGMMFSDVPNLIMTFGYINASWTLRADLTAEYACRVINHMDKLGTKHCVPRLRPQDKNMASRPWIEDFSSGYMQRTMHLFPKQGDREPWLNTQNYKRDRKMIRRGRIKDEALRFTNPVMNVPQNGVNHVTDVETALSAD
ncbi:MAG: NAD(P)/FAD-dependent oxidoreductase [Chloroflexota bacterium]